MPRWQKLVLVAWFAWFAAAVSVRVWTSFVPWSAETDWKQWLWIYHRYSTPGAFPPGHLLTDYAFTVQPPLYWAVTASLTKLLGSPVFAANALYAVALIGAAACAWWAARTRVHPLAALFAAMLVLHDERLWRFTVGGYPRSFGPTLTLLFLAAWMAKREKLVLVVLVLMSAVYPSVVVPCALAYGAWSVLLADRARWVPRNAWLVATGGVVMVIAQLQSLLAPAWWGSVVTLAQAQSMPALGPLGRTGWVPLASFTGKLLSYTKQAFIAHGRGPHEGWMPWTSLSAQVWLALLLASIVSVVALPLLDKPRIERTRDDVKRALANLPVEPLLLAGASVIAFGAARVLAFKLYLPHRMVQHVLPYAIMVFAAIVFARVLKLLTKTEQRALAMSACALPLAFLLLAGDGLLPRSLRSYAKKAPLYEWIEKNTPVDAQFAGNLANMDEVPFFSKRQAYVNWKMAHPFRLGFYGAIERRIRDMYDAYYATDIEDVLAFADEARIDYFVIDTSLYEQVERGDGNLFEPLRGHVERRWRSRRGTGFVLLGVPEEVVPFRHAGQQVIDVRKLRAWVDAHPDRDLRRSLRRVVDERPEAPNRIEAVPAGDDGEPDDD